MLIREKKTSQISIAIEILSRIHRFQLKRMKVLIVDDNTLATKLIFRMCITCGHLPVVIPFSEITDQEEFELILFNFRIERKDAITQLVRNWELARKLYLESFELMYGGSTQSFNEVVIWGLIPSSPFSSVEERESNITCQDLMMHLNPPREVTRATEAIPTKNTGRLRLLLVDDSIVVLKVISRALQKFGYPVEILERSKYLPDLLSRKKYDVVFLDINMPTLSGIEATELIRMREKETARFCCSYAGVSEDHPDFIIGNHQMVIGISSNQKHRGAAIVAGMDKFIPKDKFHDLLNGGIDSVRSFLLN